MIPEEDELDDFFKPKKISSKYPEFDSEISY